jgi:hypothetical protein
VVAARLEGSAQPLRGDRVELVVEIGDDEPIMRERPVIMARASTFGR